MPASAFLNSFWSITPTRASYVIHRSQCEMEMQGPVLQLENIIIKAVRYKAFP